MHHDSCYDHTFNWENRLPGADDYGPSYPSPGTYALVPSSLSLGQDGVQKRYWSMTSTTRQCLFWLLALPSPSLITCSRTSQSPSPRGEQDLHLCQLPTVHALSLSPTCSSVQPPLAPGTHTPHHTYTHGRAAWSSCSRIPDPCLL